VTRISRHWYTLTYTPSHREGGDEKKEGEEGEGEGEEGWFSSGAWAKYAFFTVLK